MTKKYLKIIVATFVLLGCKRAEVCNLDTVNCGNFLFVNDFENAQLGSSDNWNGFNSSATVVNYPNTSNKALMFSEGPSISAVFKTSLLPSNLPANGCEIYYDVAMKGAPSSDNSIEFYNSTNYFTATVKITFRLNSNSLVKGDGNFKTIHVPLQLASNGLLPSNSYGKWEVSPSTTPEKDVTAFNTLIQNISGISVPLDVTGSNNVIWYYDNFKLKTCCPNY